MKALSLPLSLFATTIIVGQVAASPTTADASVQPTIEQLILDLDSPKFEVRRRATEQLFQLGGDALPALVEAADDDSAEVTARAFEVLERLCSSKDDELKKQASEALASLAEDVESRSGRWARGILKEQRSASEPTPEQMAKLRAVQQFQGRFPIPMRPQPIAPNFGQPLPIQPRIANRTKVSSVNGKKTIEVTRGNDTTKIEELDGEKLRVTTKKIDNGKLVVKTSEYENAKDLEKRDPDAYKTYQTHQGGIQVVANAQALPNGIPGQVQQARIRSQQQIVKNLEVQRDRLKAQQLQKPQEAPQLQPQIDAIENFIKRISEHIKKLEDATSPNSK